MTKIPYAGRTIDQFLDHVGNACKPRTKEWYATFLQEFRPVADGRKLSEITPAVLHGWIAKRYGRFSSTTQHDAARAVVRMLNWAVEEGMIDTSPLRRFRKPPAANREAVLSGADYAALVRTAEGAIRDAVKFLWHTGARPQELRAIEAAWLGDRKVAFPQLASKGGKKRRVIYLDSMATAIASRLAAQHPRGPIFRNHRGDPWSRDCLKHAFARLRKKAGVQPACAYTIRHTWITRLLERGTPVATVAALAGNSVAVVLKHYAHVADNEAHLREHLEG